MIMESRIKTLREKRGLIQEILAAEVGITQQMLSKYERDISVIKVDILKNWPNTLMLQRIICWGCLILKEIYHVKLK